MTSCPHCKYPFTDAELLSMRQSYASRKRKTKSGGKNGGRPQRPNLAQWAERLASRPRLPEPAEIPERSLVAFEDL